MSLLQKGVAIAAGRMPKIINPSIHAVLDYAVAGAFFMMGASFWRRNKKAALSSFLCGGATAANALLTDYPGGVRPLMSFKSHGRVDAGLAGLTAAMPKFMNFEDDVEARAFGAQAVVETAVTAMTNFDYYEEYGSDRLRHREEEGAA